MKSARTYIPHGPDSVELVGLKNKVAHIVMRPYTDKVRVVFTGMVYFQKFEVILPNTDAHLISIEEALT